jgi:hypothetical protein
VKSEIKNQKFENEVILEVFKLPEVGEKKNPRICIFDFQRVAKNIEG